MKEHVRKVVSTYIPCNDDDIIEYATRKIASLADVVIFDTARNTCNFCSKKKGCDIRGKSNNCGNRFTIC